MYLLQQEGNTITAGSKSVVTEKVTASCCLIVPQRQLVSIRDQFLPALEKRHVATVGTPFVRRIDIKLPRRDSTSVNSPDVELPLDGIFPSIPTVLLSRSSTNNTNSFSVS